MKVYYLPLEIVKFPFLKTRFLSDTFFFKFTRGQMAAGTQHWQISEKSSSGEESKKKEKKISEREKPSRKQRKGRQKTQSSSLNSSSSSRSSSFSSSDTDSEAFGNKGKTRKNGKSSSSPF